MVRDSKITLFIINIFDSITSALSTLGNEAKKKVVRENKVKSEVKFQLWGSLEMESKIYITLQGFKVVFFPFLLQASRHCNNFPD